MKIELYFFPECPYCKKVLKSIKDLGLESKIILKDIKSDSKNLDFHLKKTGRQTVPCLYIDSKPMFESSDICKWLEAHHKEV